MADTPCQWCHGAAGIGLARLAALAVLDDREILAEIEAALKATRAAPTFFVDRVCRGNFGRIDFLLTAAAS
jgi:lantibiotic modifying enzyme